MDGQMDLLDALADAPQVPPFTVNSCVWATRQKCGWCGQSAAHGGGACANPNNPAESWYYSYCEKCSKKYGSPKLWSQALEIIVDRTETPRPGGLPDLSGKTKKGVP